MKIENGFRSMNETLWHRSGGIASGDGGSPGTAPTWPNNLSALRRLRGPPDSPPGPRDGQRCGGPNHGARSNMFSFLSPADGLFGFMSLGRAAGRPKIYRPRPVHRAPPARHAHRRNRSVGPLLAWIPHVRGRRWDIGTSSQMAALFVSAVGACVLLGWIFGFAALRNPLHSLFPMQSAAALCFVLSGAALWFRAREPSKRTLVPWLLLLVGTAAGLALIEHAAALALDMEEAVFADRGVSLRGDMPLSTACGFALFVAAMLLPTRTGWPVAVFSVLVLTGAAASFIAFIGHLYQKPTVLEIAPYTYTALPYALIDLLSVIGFLALFAGTLASHPGAQKLGRSEALGDVFVRRLLPAVLLLPPAIGWLCIDIRSTGFFEEGVDIALFAGLSVAGLSLVLWHAARETNRLERSIKRRARISWDILDAGLDAFVLTDAHGRILEWSRRAEAMFGWPRAAAVGSDIAKMILPKNGASTTAASPALQVSDLMASRGQIEMTARRRDGSVFPSRMVALPIQLNTRLVYSAFFEDLTELRDTEEKLRHSQKMEAVGQLAGGMAHDFNNLLTAIIGNLGLAEIGDGFERGRAIEAALSAANRAASLVDQLLAHSRRRILSPAVIDVSKLALGLQDLVNGVLGRKVNVHYRLQPEIWPALADPEQVESALLNMIINARDAMPDGGNLTIQTENAHLDGSHGRRKADVVAGDYVMLAVTDTGCGMSPDVAARACEPFFTTKPTGRGTGLGLSTIYGFATQSKGHLEIESAPGLGTTVRIYLPCLPEGKLDAPTVPDADAVQAKKTQEATAPVDVTSGS